MRSQFCFLPPGRAAARCMGDGMRRASVKRIQAASGTGALALFINLPRDDKDRSRWRPRAAPLAAPLQGRLRSAPGFP